MKFKLNLHICGIHLLNPYKTVVSHLEDLMEDVVCREFIVKDFKKSSSNVGGYVVDGLRDTLKNTRWVVGFIKWVVPWFRKGQGQAETVKLRRLKKRFKSKPVWRMACFG